MITNSSSRTNLHEVAPGIYRINTPVQIPGGADFNFNQYLVADDEPLLFHTGQKALFPLVAEAIGKVMPVERLRYLAFSHFEADECGSLNEFLAAAPNAVAVSSQVAAMIAVNDFAIRAPRTMADGEILRTGRRAFKWLDAPHVPHAWENGFMMELETKTLLCGDLFTMGESIGGAITESDILGPSDEFRRAMDYYAHSPQTAATLEKLALEHPRTLAVMHGSAWRGDGASLLRALKRKLGHIEVDPVARPMAA